MFEEVGGAAGVGEVGEGGARGVDVRLSETSGEVGEQWCLMSAGGSMKD